jgi:hypothetical protein
MHIPCSLTSLLYVFVFRRIHPYFSAIAQSQKEDIHILDGTTKLSCDVALTMLMLNSCEVPLHLVTFLDYGFSINSFCDHI